MTSVDPVDTRSTIASARPEPRRHLDGPGDRDDLDGDLLLLEEAPRGVGVGGRDPEPARSATRLVRRVVGDGGGEPASTVAERPDPWAAPRRSR